MAIMNIDAMMAAMTNAREPPEDETISITNQTGTPGQPSRGHRLIVLAQSCRCAGEDRGPRDDEPGVTIWFPGDRERRLDETGKSLKEL
jgi:hypothetical protein